MDDVLTAEQRATFDRTGILKLEGAFTAEDASRMADVIWRELERRHGIVRDDRSTWDRHPPTGLKSSKRSAAFSPILGPTVRGALDDLFGPGAWLPPKHFGNVLVTMPDADEWRVPHRIWHSDFPATLPADRVSAVKLWSLVEDVEPGGGGTPQLAGSHRLFARYVSPLADREYKRCKHGFLRSHPWLRALSTDDGAPDRNARFMESDADIDGLPARVVESTGRAGDVYVTHGWVFHTIAANATARPRLMRSTAIFAAPMAETPH